LTTNYGEHRLATLENQRIQLSKNSQPRLRTPSSSLLGVWWR